MKQHGDSPLAEETPLVGVASLKYELLNLKARPGIGLGKRSEMPSKILNTPPRQANEKQMAA